MRSWFIGRSCFAIQKHFCEAFIGRWWICFYYPSWWRSHGVFFAKRLPK